MSKKELLEQIERARQMSKIPINAGVELQFDAKWNLICQVVSELVERVCEKEGNEG